MVVVRVCKKCGGPLQSGMYCDKCEPIVTDVPVKKKEKEEPHP